MTDSAFKTGKNYYSQVFLEECKYVVKEKKISKYIIDYIEISSDSDRENCDKENSDNLTKENSNEKNYSEENSIEKNKYTTWIKKYSYDKCNFLKHIKNW